MASMPKPPKRKMAMASPPAAAKPAPGRIGGIIAAKTAPAKPFGHPKQTIMPVKSDRGTFGIKG